MIDSDNWKQGLMILDWGAPIDILAHDNGSISISILAGLNKQPAG